MARVLTALLLILALGWLGTRGDDLGHAYSVKGEQNDYYSLLVHGLQKGHLHMDFAVDPRRTSIDPNVQGKADGLFDASLYKGRYYLYFGVVPAVFLLLPYHLLTGSDLSENTAILLMVVAGLVVYWRLFAEACRRYFPGITTGQYAASLVLLAMGSGAPMLLTYSGFYEVAISAGYLCHALCWLGLFNALHSEGREARWLALASAAGGLAVGCRPNYLFALPVIALGAALLVRRGGSLGRLSLCAVLPAAVVGLALAWYNYARFGSPLEFGLSYQLDEMIRAKFPLFRLSFFWSNLKWYFLRPPAFSPYFPYVFPMNAGHRPEGYYGYESIHGQLAVTLLGLLTLCWLFARMRRAPVEPRVRTFMGLLGTAFALLFLGMAFYGNRAERYTVDFQSSLVLLIVVAAGASASWRSDATLPRAWRLAFIVVALCGALANVLASLQLNERFEDLHPSEWRTLSYWGDLPSALLGRMGLMHFGPVRFKIVIPPLKGDVSVTPLLATGLPSKTDVLYLTQIRGNVIQLTVTHTGLGEVKSGLMAVDPQAEHEVEVDFGSLYPPRNYPWLRRSGDEDVELLKTTAVVRFDHRVVIDRRVTFFDSPPGWVSFGHNPGGIDPPFEGKILETKLLPARLPAELNAGYNEPGVCRLAITFPFEFPNTEEPLVGSGTARRGNILLLHTLGDHSIQFDLDQWGLGMIHSPRIPVEKDGTHRLEIFIGGQVARAGFPSKWNLDPALIANAEPYLRLWLDDKPVWTTRVTINRDTYQSISVGSNPQRFSSAPSYYLGQIESESLSPDEVRSSIEENITEGAGIRGLHGYKVEFPRDSPLTGLPLLGIGVAGNGNLLFARAVRPGTYRLGMDDWGLAAQEGPVFPLSPGLHDLQIVLGPVVATEGLPQPWAGSRDLSPLRGRFLVFIDHQLRGSFDVTHHLDQLGILTPGANPQGFSTAAPVFLGPQFVPVPMNEAEARALVAGALDAARRP
jgi:hypothetical protein